nr:MAG TPA: hypothetical protein [Caudoviricetes sp.]
MNKLFAMRTPPAGQLLIIERLARIFRATPIVVARVSFCQFSSLPKGEPECAYPVYCHA